MGRKAKYTKQQKVQVCEDYLNGVKIVNHRGKTGSISCGAGCVPKNSTIHVPCIKVH